MEDYRVFWATVTTLAILAVYVLVEGAMMLWVISPVASVLLVGAVMIGTQYLITSVS